MDWSKIRNGRARAYELLPRLQQAPLIAGGETLIQGTLAPGVRVLDVGAHDRRIERWLKSQQPGATYRSLDVDRSLPHDYYAFEDVREDFDLVTILDVVEHVPPETVLNMLTSSLRVLRPGGRVVITTPNVSHPVRLWRDCTHVTAMHHAELGGFLVAAGFVQPRLYRIRDMGWRDWMLYPFVWPTLKLLEIDFAFGIALTADKPD
jgi:2-polyprenyl-3-methyl-5-hydroxy-6-metoxy-1,4-benzoquinol methylase